VPGPDGGHQRGIASEGAAAADLDRTEAYTAILIDDLISKGTNEPYECSPLARNFACTCVLITPIAV